MRERKSVKSNLPEQPQQSDHNSHSSPFKLAKLLDPDASWDKDQLCDVLHWIRQALALVFGLLWGAIPLVGGIWFILFVVLSTAIIYTYYSIILKIDEEDFGGHGSLLQEGLFASVCLFLFGALLIASNEQRNRTLHGLDLAQRQLFDLVFDVTRRNLLRR